MDERFNITMPAELAESVDRRARLEHQSRSGLIREALKSFLRSPIGGDRPAADGARPAETPRGGGTLADADVLADRLRAFCVGQDDIVAAYLFGSAAEGKAGPLSDVDVAVLLDSSEPAGAGRLGGLRHADLSARLPAVLGVSRVDVVILDSAPSSLAFRAVSRGRMVVGADVPARLRFEVELLHRYLDHLPLEREYAHALRERVARGELVAR